MMNTFVVYVENKPGVLVRIAADGTLTYGPEYTPDEAAKMFWEALARRRADYEERLVFLAHVEKLLARIGEQWRAIVAEEVTLF